VNPELMGFHMSAHAIMMVILGGMGNFAGAIVGAFSFEYLLHVFKDLPDVGAFKTGKHWQMWMGLFIVALIIFAPKGILGLINRVFGRKTAQEAGHD
jgi:branched-chain amino acid transport system permease protein